MSHVIVGKDGIIVGSAQSSALQRCKKRLCCCNFKLMLWVAFLQQHSSIFLPLMGRCFDITKFHEKRIKRQGHLSVCVKRCVPRARVSW